ncbi:MAG: hypothetical protein OEY29_08480 [Gammaproteobacteria bacterium]|nr:hypothetical protein [Gammaproteobacteria bacterium]
MKANKTKIHKLKAIRQNGAALLIAMVVLASVAAFYLMGQFGAVSQKQIRQDNRVASLAEAKKALIAYAVNYIDSNAGEMAFLPCPDRSAGGFSEGIQDGVCEATNVNTIGRFPWRSLDLAPQYDETNECLWYAVSGYYKSNPKTQMLNEDTNGLFSIFNAQGNLIYGNSPEDRVVAVIIAPNVPIQAQDRSTVAGTERCKGNYTIANYLDRDAATLIDNSNLSVAADTTDDFIKAGTNSTFNDLLLTITRDEIWSAVKRRRDFTTSIQTLANNIAQCVVAYGNDTPVAGQPSYLPWPAEVDLSLADYRIDASYVDAIPSTSLLGRLADDVSNSQLALDSNSFVAGGAANLRACKKQCQTEFNACKKSCKGKTCNDACQIQRDDCNAACSAGGTPVPTARKSIDNVITSCLIEPDLTLWKHWKDHFFYVVSGAYQPDSADASCAGANDCVTLNGNATKYPGIVFFAGEKTATQLRRESPDADTKQNIINYLEGNNAANYPDAAGNKDYDSTLTSDVLYCISEGPPLSAAPCP